MQIGSFSSAICLLLKDVLLLPMFARCCLYRMETGRLSCRNLTGSGEDHPENSTAASIYRAGIQMRFLYLYDRCMHLYPCFIVHLQYTYRLFTFADIYHTTGKRNLQVKSLIAIYDADMGAVEDALRTLSGTARKESGFWCCIGGMIPFIYAGNHSERKADGARASDGRI